MTVLLAEPEVINFGDFPATINALLQQGVTAYRQDYVRADQLFRKALAAAPDVLPIYFCLYKIHTYQGNLEEAQVAAEQGLKKATGQAGWNSDWRQWQPEGRVSEGAGHFALYALKALAFINLKQNKRDQAERMLAKLREMDPTGAVGWPVIAALAEALD